MSAGRLRNLPGGPRENLRREAREQLLPETLVTLIREADRRWVRSAADWQKLRPATLTRFQQELHGVPATAQVWWIARKVAGKSRRMAGHDINDENYFSNVLRQDLQRANLLVRLSKHAEVASALKTQPLAYLAALQAEDLPSRLAPKAVRFEAAQLNGWLLILNSYPWGYRPRCCAALKVSTSLRRA